VILLLKLSEFGVHFSCLVGAEIEKLRSKLTPKLVHKRAHKALA
jgi:hypothetical protein